MSTPVRFQYSTNNVNSLVGCNKYIQKSIKISEYNHLLSYFNNCCTYIGIYLVFFADTIHYLRSDSPV